jgi:hypothetical protein
LGKWVRGSNFDFVGRNIFVWEQFRKRAMESEFFVKMFLLETYFWMMEKGIEKNLLILSSMNMKDLETWWMIKKLPKEIEHFIKSVCVCVFFCIFFLNIVMEKNKNRRVVERICNLLVVLFFGNCDGEK